MSKVGKTPKPAVAMLRVTTPSSSTLGSDNKLAQAVLKEGKEKAVKTDPEKGKDDDRDILIRRVPKF